MKIRSKELSARTIATATACMLAAIVLGGCAEKEESNNDREAGPPPARIALQQTVRDCGKYLLDHKAEAKTKGKLTQQRVFEVVGHLKKNDDVGIYSERKTPKGTELSVEAVMERGADGKLDPSTTYYLGLNSVQYPNSAKTKFSYLAIEGLGKAEANSEWGASLRKGSEHGTKFPLDLYIDGEKPLTSQTQDIIDKVLPRCRTTIAG